MANKTYFRGQGKVFVAPRNADGLTGGYIHIGDAEAFMLDVSQSFDDVHESMSGQRLVAAHVPTETIPSVKMTMLEWSRENLVRALYGSSTGAISAGSVTGEELSVYASSSIFLAHRNVSTVVVEKGVTPLVLDTDYTLDAKSGMLTFLPGSTEITGSAAVDITVDYAYAASSGKVEAITSGVKNYSIVFAGINGADNDSAVKVECHNCALNLPKSLSFLDSKVAKLELDGMLLADWSKGDGLSKFFTIEKE